MQYAVCCVPVSPLRKEPLHTTEMISQQLFGECCTVLEAIPGWIKIRCRYDAYEGWCQGSQLVEIDERQFMFAHEKLAIGYLNTIIYNGQKMFVPFGSSVATFIQDNAIWQNNTCSYKGKIHIPSEDNINKIKIKQIAGKFLNTPYLWGGKSVFGIYCSGFSQAVYKFFNIYLPRNSWQQAASGVKIDLLEQANTGDLCFFDNEEGRIIHVGILLNQHQVIHSSGKVRIDEVDDTGILNGDTNLRTHSLKIIKRYFNTCH